jgi:hypothetical protein
MNLSPGSLARFLVCGILRSLANDGVFHDRIAEMVDHRCDGKHATEAFVKGLLLRVCCRPAEEHGDDCGDLQSEMLHETTPQKLA